MKALASVKSAAPKKAWAMPELKKIDIESITASDIGLNLDAGSFSS